MEEFSQILKIILNFTENPYISSISAVIALISYLLFLGYKERLRKKESERQKEEDRSRDNSEAEDRNSEAGDRVRDRLRNEKKIEGDS